MEQQTQPTDPTEESIFTEDDYSMKGYDKHVRNARITLYIIAAISLLGLFLFKDTESSSQKNFLIGFIIVLAGAYAFLGYWSTKKPFTAILIGLILFILMQVLSAIDNPSSLIQGWYVRIAVTLFLILGLRNAKEIEDKRKAFGK